MRQFWVLAAAAAALTGCGGAGPSTTSGSAPTATATATPAASVSPTPSGSPVPASDADAISSLVTQVEVIHDYKRQCKQLFTSAYLAESFGTLAECQKWGFQNPSDYPTSATVTSIVGAGNSASGVVTDHGGVVDGASGPWEFERSASGQWQLAAQSAAYLRMSFADQFGPRYESRGAADFFTYAPYRACLVSAMVSRDDATFKSLLNALDVAGHAATLVPVIESCASSGQGGQSPFRAILNSTVRAALTSAHASTGAIDCVITGLGSALTDDQVTAALLDGKGSPAEKDLSAAETDQLRKCQGATVTPKPGS